VASFSINSNGIRGVVQSGAGQYDISNTLNNNARGVILRGVGDSADAASNTIVRSTSTQQITMVQVDSLAATSIRLNGTGLAPNGTYFRFY